MNIDGMPVKNAKKNQAISVAAIDIKNGKSLDHRECAFAQSWMRSLPVVEAIICKTRTYVRYKAYKDKWVMYITPSSAKAEIVVADRQGKFFEGTHVFLAPKKYQRLGSRPSKNHGKRNPNTKRVKRAYHVTEGVRSHGPGH